MKSLALVVLLLYSADATPVLRLSSSSSSSSPSNATSERPSLYRRSNPSSSDWTMIEYGEAHTLNAEDRLTIIPGSAIGITRARLRVYVATRRFINRLDAWTHEAIEWMGTDGNANVKEIWQSLAKVKTIGVVTVVAIFLGFTWWIGQDERSRKEFDPMKLEEQITLAEALTDYELENELCQRVYDMGTMADQSNEEFYGQKQWQAHWTAFEPIFEAAQDEAMAVALRGIANEQITQWPSLDPLPLVVDKPTPEEHVIYFDKLKKWSEKNILTVPLIRHGIETTYRSMLQQVTLDAVYAKRNQVAFIHDKMAYFKLTDVFFSLLTFPEECTGKVHEPLARTTKMAGLRKSRTSRDGEIMEAMNNMFRETEGRDDETEFEFGCKLMSTHRSRKEGTAILETECEVVRAPHGRPCRLSA